jgi:hypothetical protein
VEEEGGLECDGAGRGAVEEAGRGHGEECNGGGAV